jgi:uncharacterized membrane protein HdeD (DUF308 family)
MLTHTTASRPTSLWYLVAFLFGLLGGLIAYVAVKDEDKGMANNCILIGIMTTIFGAILIYTGLQTYLAVA